MSSPIPDPRRVVVLGAGGTIAGRADRPDDGVVYSAGELGVQELLAVLEPPPGVTLVAEQVAQLDSKDMSHAVWRQLALRCVHWLQQPDVAGVVITHGTDTLEETAFFLQSVLGPLGPVVLTCAMRPATARHPDGPQNLRDALTVATTPGAAGVTVVCAGTVHSALDVRKTHTYRLDAFGSGDAGALGYVEEGGIRLVRNWPSPPAGWAEGAMNLIAIEPVWPRVEIVGSHAGARGVLIDLLVGAGEVDGLVLAATGNGTLHADLLEAALRAREAGVAVLRATRCAQGRILPHGPSPLPDAGALGPAKARVALMLQLLAVRAGGPR